MKKWIIIIVVLSIIVAASAYRVNRLMTEKPAESVDKIQQKAGLPVRVFEVQRRDLSDVVAVSGSIEAYRRTSVAPTVVDRIETIHVATGQHVQAGDLLATLETTTSQLLRDQAAAALAEAEGQLEKLRNGSRPEEIEAARAAMEQAEAQYELAAIERGRQATLYEEEASTLQQLQDAQRAEKVAKAALAAARAQHQLVQKGPRDEDIAIAADRVALARVDLSRAEKNLRDHYLKAPTAGVVTDNLLEPGDVAEMNTILFYVLEIDRVYLAVDVSEIYIPSVAVGMTVDVTIDSLPGVSFRGDVAEINPMADVRDRSFRVKILLDNQAGKLLPGMFGRAHIEVRAARDALVIPNDAIRGGPGAHFVYIVDDENKVRRIDIPQGRVFGDLVALTNTLQPGMRVVTLAHDALKPGMPATIAQDQSTAAATETEVAPARP